MCSCEHVRGLTNDPLCNIKDPAIINFYSFPFDRQTWTLRGDINEHFDLAPERQSAPEAKILLRGAKQLAPLRLAAEQDRNSLILANSRYIFATRENSAALSPLYLRLRHCSVIAARHFRRAPESEGPPSNRASHDGHDFAANERPNGSIDSPLPPPPGGWYGRRWRLLRARARVKPPSCRCHRRGNL